MENNTLIRTRNLKKYFPMGESKFTALDDISITIGKGEFTGLVGPSGSGKTTLLNIIGTLDIPSEGEAIVLGRSVGELSHKEAARLRNEHYGFIFQTYNLLPVYTVYENVEFPLLLLKMPLDERKKAVIAALEWVGLLDKIESKPALLSGGECQRVAIARAMVKKPKIVIADEPTANLDAKNSHNILKTMENLNKELDTSFIFATHDEKVIRYLRRIITLEDGKVADDRTVAK
ncbi:MAG: ABC transporter ATP-binding protein [Desulfobacteraceae bacterium]|jgi:putative ABC transport system ATP-binding protein